MEKQAYRQRNTQTRGHTCRERDTQTGIQDKWRNRQGETQTRGETDKGRRTKGDIYKSYRRHKQRRNRQRIYTTV